MEASIVVGPSMVPESPAAPATSLCPCVLQRSKAQDGGVGGCVSRNLTSSSGTSSVCLLANQPRPVGLSLVLWDWTYMSDAFKNYNQKQMKWRNGCFYKNVFFSVYRNTKCSLFKKNKTINTQCSLVSIPHSLILRLKKNHRWWYSIHSPDIFSTYKNIYYLFFT